MLALASIIILGILAQWIAWRLRIPAILPLILIGLIAGPLVSIDFLLGYKWIEPTEIFLGDYFHYFVSLSVGVILFEGGLTLKFREVRHVAGTVRNLVLIGPFISMIGGGLAAHFILGLGWRVALLFGALIIVTGPTVIGPILRQVRPKKKVSTILKWESILIDPVGAFFAVLVYEYILSGAGAEFSLEALITFGRTILAGFSAGLTAAFILYVLLRNDLIPNYLIELTTLAMVFSAFVAADLIASESGLLSVTIMGMTLANLKVPRIKEILNFKETLTVLLISILFIVLSANINMDQLKLLGWRSFVVFAIVIFLIRPVSVFLCSIRGNLTFKEKIFISWIGPRGIVAAAIASIFAISLIEKNVLSQESEGDTELLIPLTFLIILGTVILQGLTARPFARMLGLTQKSDGGFILLGANEPARLIAKYIRQFNHDITLVDTNHNNINEARLLGLKVMERDVLSDEMVEEAEIMSVSRFMALTPNNELNIFACRKFRKEMNIEEVYRLITKHEKKFTDLARPKHILFDYETDFYRLIELSRKYPGLKEAPLDDESHLNDLLQLKGDNMIPIFIRKEDGQIQVIKALREDIKFDEGDVLVYFGQDINPENFTTPS